MAKTRVLYVLHNHPTLFPGGAEQYALELFEALRGSDEIEPLLLARISRTSMPQGNRPGTPFSTLDGEPDQYFLFTESEPTYDYFFGTSRNKSLYTTYFADFLAAYKPDVVHFQHTLHMGYDLVSTARRVLPQAPILYTLHEYLPICHREGQMLRTEHKNEELCLKASPRRCSECFPDIPSREFFLRERRIKAHLDNVDLFIAPSEFLRQRYVDWGIPPDRIVCEDYGRRPAVRLAEHRGGPAAQPLRLLRPVQPLQGRRDAARGDGDLRASAPTSSCGCTAPTSTSRPTSSRTTSPRCSSGQRRTSRWSVRITRRTCRC